MRAREKNPDFTLDLQIFSADPLEKPDTDMIQPDMFARLNSRVQLTQESFQRYQRVMHDKFDKVFGNPPWGGVRKGRLAPVYDTAKKQRFAIEFPAAAQGKYDVYGLFMERSLQILKPHGRFGLLTQGTFIDKEWAAGLRELLSNKADPLFIVDLNPFGQLFFHAMNTPCITVADVTPEGGDNGHCVAVISMPPGRLAGKGIDERRKVVDATLRDAVRQAERQNSVQVGFAHAAKIPRGVLRATAKDRWNLLLSSTPVKMLAGTRSVGDLLEMRQGVTPGGCLDVFLLTEQTARNLELESALVHRESRARKFIAGVLIGTGWSYSIHILSKMARRCLLSRWIRPS